MKGENPGRPGHAGRRRAGPAAVRGTSRPVACLPPAYPRWYAYTVVATLHTLGGTTSVRSVPSAAS